MIKIVTINTPTTFFVDDLKLYATDMSTARRQLEIGSTFLKDIGMKIWKEKMRFSPYRKGIN